MLNANKKHQGFTLIECLIALVVLSGMLLTFSMLIQASRQIIQTVENNRKKEFEIFLLQLENEASVWEFVEVSGNIISFVNITDDKNERMLIRLSNQKINKNSGSTTLGNQLLLDQVQTFNVKQQDNTLEIEVVFVDRQTCKGKYILPWKA